MKRLLLTLIMIVCAVHILVAQDVIVTRQTARIDAKVLEVSEDEVKYKKASDPDGPLFVLSTDKIAYINFANGDIQVFDKQQQKVQLSENDREMDKSVVLGRKGRRIVNIKVRDISVPNNLRELLGAEEYENYRSARLSYGTGSTLVTFGWLSLIAGLTLSFHGGYTLNSNEALGGILIAGVADVLLPVGYIVRGVAAGRISRIAEGYNADARRSFGMDMSVSPSLLLGSNGTVAPGVGVTFRF